MTRASTEARNPLTMGLDTLQGAELVRTILAEEAVAVAAAQAAGEQLAAAVDLAVQALESGGRIHYFGAGASGRLAVLDATEVTPTFGVDRSTVQAHFPGGLDALVDSTIDLEDAAASGAEDAAGLGASDLAFGVTASGGTAYVRGALQTARAAGAATVLLSCVTDPAIEADVVVIADTGAEALTGSTRLKAGTATKVLLNAFSTAVMVRRGRVYSNLMTGMSITNDKLRQRAAALLGDATGAESSVAEAALADAHDRVDVALVALRAQLSAADAASALSEAGSVRAVVGDELARS